MTPQIETAGNSEKFDSIVINEVQLLLAEKRTSLAVMRTGIAVLALPLSVVGLLIATSKYYNIFNVLHLVIPFVILNLGLIVLGCYLITRAVIKMHSYDKHIHELKVKFSALGQFIQ
ncbi:hypothetical protein [Desulfobacter sp.]|uniref:hypothetical protein n=1 Tax=Desulfobacter sp. TaxID=2294 RepID=UPI003D0F39A1